MCVQIVYSRHHHINFKTKLFIETLIDIIKILTKFSLAVYNPSTEKGFLSESNTQSVQSTGGDCNLPLYYHAPDTYNIYS